MPGPWEKYGGAASAAPAMGDPIVKPAPTAKAPDPLVQESRQLDIELKRKQLAKPDAADRPKAPDAKAQAKTANLDALVEQINRVQELYDQSLKDEPYGPLSSATEYLPTPANSQFDSAAAGMAEQGLASFRVPGVGSQSDTELRQFVEANRPSASDYDTQIEEKLRQLRTRVDATRASMGLEPAQWGQAVDDTAPPQFAMGDGNVAGVTRDNGDSGAQTTLSQDGTDRTDNPALAGVRDEYLRRLGAGQGAQEILKWAREAGVHPSAFRSIQEQVQFRKEHPDAPLNQYDTTQLDDKFVQLGTFDNMLNSAAQSPLGAGLIAAGDAASGFTLDNIVGATGGNAERARLGIAQVADRNPISSTVGMIGGGALTALGGEAALGARGMAAGIPRAMAADSAYGALAGAGGTDDGSSRLAGAARGALAAAGGSYLGAKTGNALAKSARGVSDPSVNALRSEGVNALTAGQTYANSGRIGAAVKGIEDRLSGVPVVGDMVNARRAEGFRQFNTKAFDKALEPIGGTVGDAVGEDAVEKAQKIVSDAFTTALAGKGVVPDGAFNRDLSRSLMGVQNVKRVGPEVFDEVVDILKAYDNEPMLSGEALQDISRQLRDVKFAYARDPLFKRVGGQIDRVERAVFDLFDRQASGTVPEYNKARQAYRRLSIMEDAVMAAQNSKDQLVTPAQLARADKTNTRRFGGKAAAARGDTPFRSLTEPAQDVMPNKVPDSGTAGRLLVPLALVGGGSAADQTGLTNGNGLTIGAILAALYSKTGQRLLTKPGRGMKDGTFRRDLLESPKLSRSIAGGAAVSGVLATQQ